MHRRRALTLVEVIAVLIIVSILAVVAIPNYQRTVEQARDKEAVAVLRLVQAGERIYRSRVGFYYPFSGSESAVVQINDNLNLNLTEQTWDYIIQPIPGNFAAAAFKNTPTGFQRAWFIRDIDCNPNFGAACRILQGGSCPPGSDNTACF